MIELHNLFRVNSNSNQSNVAKAKTEMSQWHSRNLQEIIQSLDANPERGLTDQEASKRLKKYGLNKFLLDTDIRFFSILKEEITEPFILLLIGIGVLYSIWGNLTDALTIIIIVSILVLVEVWNEYRAKRSIASLKKLASPTAMTIRNGQITEIQTSRLVPGDIVLLKPGQRVPADARLIDEFGLEVDEASFSGESFPVSKDVDQVLPAEARITEQLNMVFAGTVVTKGQAKALVTSTGANTELGRVAGIAKATKDPKTPLQLAMKQLSKTLILFALFFSVLVPILGILRGLGVQEMILTSLSLAFATVPEEMPIIVTMVLGLGAYALSKENALVKRLRAAETLGNVTVIATDKTGTITENRMKMSSLFFDGRVVSNQDFKENEKEALKTALPATDAVRESSDVVLKNPMYRAIAEELRSNGVDAVEVAKAWVLKDELSFDNNRKLATYVYEHGNSLVALSSGAPENLLADSNTLFLENKEVELTENNRTDIATIIAQMAKSGERLLAFGYRRLSSERTEELERNLVFVGIMGFIDPPRAEVKDAVQACQAAGIKVVMVTGDHPETARAIADQVGIDSRKVLTGNDISRSSDEELKHALDETFVFARTTPEDKLRLVRILRKKDEVVAVTGDGINDAPALKEAHIGVAMGIRGTDVAKETADIILTDDNFSTIQTAVREGRKLFSNLKKGVRYYLACKLALVASFLLPIALGVPLPFAPIQIIVLELFMDLAASATFVAEPQEKGIMTHPPLNPKEKFMNRNMITTIVVGALSLFLAVSVCFLFTYYQTQDLVRAQTVAFATWMAGHIFLALNLRSDKEPLTELGLLSNKVMILWALLVAATLVIATSLPFLHEALKITALSLQDWILVLVVAFITTFWIEFWKMRKSQLSHRRGFNST